MAQSRAPSTCQTFVFGKPLVKNTFFESFTKKMLRLWISKIRIWIWSEDSTQSVDFKDSWFVFGIGNPYLDFPKKTHPFTTVAIVLESENNRHTCKLHLWRGAFFGGGRGRGIQIRISESKNGSWILKIYTLGGFFGSNPNENWISKLISLERKDCVKYQRVLTDSNLSWKYHIKDQLV